MKQFVNKHTKAKTLIAKSSIQINNTIDEAWKALVNPEIVEKYMPGSQQLSDWQKGSSIIWKKDFNGRKFVDKGEILEFTPPKSLKYTHYSPASGKPDAAGKLPDRFGYPARERQRNNHRIKIR